MSPEATTLLASIPLIAGGVGGARLLRRAWGDRSARRPLWIVGGWALLATLTFAYAFWLGPARGPFIAVTLISVCVLLVVAWGMERRTARGRAERSLAPEPSNRGAKAWRGWLRALLAGPIGMIAAMGTAIAFVAFCPGAAETRLVLGGLLAPLLWGAAMAWTLADDKILRATAVLVGVSLATFAAAMLKGF